MIGRGMSWRTRLVNWFMDPSDGPRIVKYGYTRGQDPTVVLAITTMKGEVIAATLLNESLVDQLTEYLVQAKAQMGLVQR